MRKKSSSLATLTAALLLGVSSLAADSVIRRGIDVFTTTANGNTYYDFAHNPVPAGFFCKRSAAFTDRVALKGLPLATGAAGQLHGADTVVERLDDAVFDADGTAVTRVQFRALSMASVAPIKTACGAFHVYVSLAGKQPATTMRIFRTHENGGSFVAPLTAKVRITFIPVKPPKNGSSRRLELAGSVTFAAKPIPWSLTGGPSAKRIGSALVDTNGDLTPDALLFGSSNFSPGWSPEGVETILSKGCTLCEPEVCHTESGEQHCTGPVYACYPANCP